MTFLNPPAFLLTVLLLTLIPVPASSFRKKKPYVVFLGTHAYRADVSPADLQRVTETHYQLLGSFLDSPERAKDAIFYSYQRRINGFAALLEEEEAAEIAKQSEVVSVFLSRGHKLHTTHSWDFMHLERHGTVPSDSLWHAARFGQDIIIANLDTGVWPESPSFNDKGYGPVPARWKGKCPQDTDFEPVSCNRKLIGARYFYKGYEAFLGQPLNHTFYSARDYGGHGTHTLSTAAGEFVPRANVLGFGNGTAKGGSPHARVAAYKVCWWPVNGSECFDADILAAFDMAIHDGVDVLSISLGSSPVDYLKDVIAIGSFHAVQSGITVVASAGNAGPALGTVSNVAPWMITVGASTIDREFQASAILGSGKRFRGNSLSKGLPKRKIYPLMSAANAGAANETKHDALLCKEGALDPENVKGKILVCLRGETGRLEKGYEAARAGAMGMILCNDESSGDELNPDAHFLPATQLTFSACESVFNYVNATRNPRGFITTPMSRLGTVPAPFMATFSSRGPNIVTPTILKPDITAPGVYVIAAFSEAASPTDVPIDKRHTAYNMESGTSMSCPHVAGVVGLLKSVYPDWSSAAIKSAIMTTAITRDNTMNAMRDQLSFHKASPLAYGSGHIRPNRAMDPGLVYDLSSGDYLDFLCAVGYNKMAIRTFTDDPYVCAKSATLLDFNYPSIAIPNLSGSVTVTRRLKNVGKPGTYRVRVHQPVGVRISVQPQKLQFIDSGEEKTFQVTVQAKWKGPAPEHVFGTVTWTDGKHYVRTPLTVITTVNSKT